MPELPEVETVRRGLVPVLEGATIVQATAHRPDLRFPLPARFGERLTGAAVGPVRRRGKYILAPLSTGETLILHLGMSGRFHVLGEGTLARFHNQVATEPHIHVTLSTRTASGESAVVHYADPRRFGFMDLVPSGEIETCRHFAGMGPEPLSAAFTPAALQAGLAGKRTPLKSALLDQRVVAGLGNIYVCEALYRAGLSPRRLAGTVGPARALRLHGAIVSVLEEAIEAGGSSLRDYVAADGTMGRFQHGFAVYDREGEACRKCGGPVDRIVQSGRSTFFCGRCQR